MMHKGPSKLKILVVDDHPLYREGVSDNLKKLSFVRKVLTLENGAELIALLKRDENFHLVFLDIEMSGMDGLETMKMLRMFNRRIPVVILTTHNKPSYIAAMYDLKVNGYILKEQTTAELLKIVIETVWAKGSYFPDEIIKFLFEKSHRVKLRESKGEFNLTEREKEVVKLVCKGYSNLEISALLCLSENTIKTHRKAIYKKLKCNTPALVAIYALKHNLV